MEIGLAAAFLAGIVSFLSPCILPLVPPYLCFLAGASLDELSAERSAVTTSRVMGRAGAFVAGFGAVFVALGAGASTIGGFLMQHLTILTQVAGLVIVLLGLHMLGVFRFLFMMREARFHIARRPAGMAGAFVVGLAFAFGWSPCVGPVLASILMMASFDEGAGRGAALLAAYAAGIGIPFLAAALFTGPFLRWLSGFRKHLGMIEKAMGGALVATGVVIALGYMPIFAGWLLDMAPVLGRIG